jgi:hypothetical protein
MASTEDLNIEVGVTVTKKLTWQRALQFCLAPVVDGYKGISITRLMSIQFAVLVWVSVTQQLPVSMNTLWLALAAMAAAFGKSTFSFLLTRMQRSDTHTEARTVNETITHTIQERRDTGAGFEATP